MEAIILKVFASDIHFSVTYLYTEAMMIKIYLPQINLSVTY